MKTSALIPPALIPQYPLLVLVPDGGERYLLHWTTSYDRGKLVVARTLAALHKVAAVVLSEHPSATILGACRVELVSPPEPVRTRYAQHRYNERVQHFWIDIVYRARDGRELGVPLAYPLRRCPGYVEGPDLDPETDGYRTAAEDKDHTYCEACMDKIAPVEGETPASLYLKAERRYMELEARENAALPRYQQAIRRNARPRGELVPAPSRAREADPMAILGAVVVEAGDHAKGICLDAVSPLDLEDYPQSANFQSPETSRPIGFFFHLIEALDLEPFEALKRAAKKVEKKREKLTQAEQEDKRRAERFARVEALTFLFPQP